MDDKFELLVSETHALREEMRAGFVDVRTEIVRARDELRADTAGIRRDLSAFQRQVTFIVAAFALGLLGLLGAGQF